MIINDTAQWPEVFCAYAISEVIFSCESFVVGDVAREHIPDIYNVEKTLGIEVVQLEQDCDLDSKYVWDAYYKNNGDYEKVKKFCNEKYPGVYELFEYGGKLGAFSTSGGAHNADWMQEINSRNLNKKLKKLNSGNYSGINGQVFLCTVITQRAKSLYDAHLVLYDYLQVAKNYKVKFDRIIVLTSSNLYLLDPNKIEEMFPIKASGVICDFKIKGKDYLVVREYDYNKTSKWTKSHFKG